MATDGVTPSTGTLFVVASPLGNLGDVSRRCRDTLAAVDQVWAEDTRRARVLLTSLELHKPLHSLHAHNERSRADAVCEALAAGKDVAFLSDAGTPAVSDPGAHLVRLAHEAGHKVCPIPGPSALSTAVSAAGFADGPSEVLFLGFLPRAGKQRSACLARLQAFTGVVVLFESPHRVAATLKALAELQPARLACVCRELTKIYEEVRRAPLQELLVWAESKQMRGEFTLVLGPASRVGEDDDNAETATTTSNVKLTPAQAVRRCLDAGLRVRDVAAAVSALLEVPRREAYRLALAAAEGAATPADIDATGEK